MIRKILALAILLSLTVTNIASAHVLVTDTTQKYGAILHIMPDDDPVAGQAGDIFYDIQTTSGVRKATLTITDATGQAAAVPTRLKGSTVNADYTFPAQGLYRIVLTATIDNQLKVFEHTQRVSRGITAGDNAAQGGQVLGETLVIFAGAGFCVLAITAFNRLRYTKKNVSRK